MATVQACPACRTGVLARRGGDPLCPTCMKAAREMPSQPSWLFDSPLLRQALAEVNLPAVPAIVRAACGVSQRDLATMVGWSQAALSYYERGIRDGMYDIRTALQFADAVGMPRAALLPLVFADADAGLTAGTGDGTGMELSRRDFGGLAAAAGLSGGPARRERAAPGDRLPRPVLAGVRGRAVRPRPVRRRDRPAAACHAAVAARPARRAGRRRPGKRAASCSRRPGNSRCARDGSRSTPGSCRLARPLYEEARELAAGSGDALLGVHVLTNQSMLHAELARTGPSREPARQALRLAFQAQDEGRYLPVPRLHALIALRHASAASLLGDKAAFQEAITQARRELDRGSRDETPPEWLRFVDRTEITGVEARGWLNLGDPGRSALLYRQVLASGLSPRNRASYGAGLADALLKQGARQDAIAAATDVLPALEGGVTSMRCLNRLRLVRQAAASIPGCGGILRALRRDRAGPSRPARPARRRHARLHRAGIPALSKPRLA